MFEIIKTQHKSRISELVRCIKNLTVYKISTELDRIIKQIYTDIPPNKRISYGRYSIIKKMGEIIYPQLNEINVDIQALAYGIFEKQESDCFVRSLGIQLASIFATETGELNQVLILFERAAIDKTWEVRESAVGFVRKLIKEYPDFMHKWFFEKTKSESHLLRRFVCESLRPVAENRWFKNNSDYPFPILKNLFTESAEYPRTSIGNGLSDWIRINEKVSLPIVKELATNGNKNSYWIAYRACRNLVKKNPILVMDILKTDSYKYKNRKYLRKDYQ